MNELLNKTLSQIVTENYQAAPVFEKYGLDFCCKGKRPLKQACDEKDIDLENLLKDLHLTFSQPAAIESFSEMSLTELCEYIVRVHHNYVRQSSAQIMEYIDRVAFKHGDRFPYMIEVRRLFAELKNEMDQHMMKEEKVLFPGIKLMEITGQFNNGPGFPGSAIGVMEDEHDLAGNITENIRKITNNYEVPEQACTTFRLTLASLRAFEEDLHKHVHLENNILFPKSIKRFEELNAATDQNSCSLVR